MPNTFENWLVVSDIDGTLKNKMKRIPRRNYDAIKNLPNSAVILHLRRAE